MEMKDKNEKILDLMENIEDFKVEIYSRDRTIDLQQEQLEDVKVELGKAKKFEYLCKSLEIENQSLRLANDNLQKQINEDLEKYVKFESEKMDKNSVQMAM